MIDTTSCSLYIVFFSKILKYSGPFSVFPRRQCVYTHRAGRIPALQQNWQSSEKSQNFNENTIFIEHPVSTACKKLAFNHGLLCTDSSDLMAGVD